MAARGASAPETRAATLADAATRAAELSEAAVAGDRLALARLLTAVENRTPVAEAALREAGVAEIFGPGTTIAQVADYLRANARPRD